MAALPGHIGLAFDTGASWTRAQYATEGSNPELADIVLDKSCSATLSQGLRQVVFLLPTRLSLALDRHLCRGMRMLQDASCAQLSNTSYLQEVIQTTGVTYDPRKRDVCRTWFEPRTNRLSNDGLELQARIPDEHACYARVRA